jgi:hypothetical protein
VGGPGLAFETWVSPEKSVLPEHPGLKIETWATHSIIVKYKKQLAELSDEPSLEILREVVADEHEHYRESSAA